MPYYIMEQDDRKNQMNVISCGFISKSAADGVLQKMIDLGDFINRNDHFRFVSEMSSDAAKVLLGTSQKKCAECEDWIVLDDFNIHDHTGYYESRWCSDCRCRLGVED